MDSETQGVRSVDAILTYMERNAHRHPVYRAALDSYRHGKPAGDCIMQAMDVLLMQVETMEHYVTQHAKHTAFPGIIVATQRAKQAGITGADAEID